MPAMEQMLKRGSQLGLKEVVLGMAHRGRLNVLANFMGKPFKAIFSEFQGNSAHPEDVQGSGDVKYHLGTSSDREFDGAAVHLSLSPNPSHLEAVDPVVIGRVRAKQIQRSGTVPPTEESRDEVLGILLHGDAAFAGQGLVAETLMMSELKGYRVGGTIHFIINNQIGFTTMPSFSRSGPYLHRRREDDPGADLPRQRRRPGSGGPRLAHRDRVPSEVQEGRGRRPVLLSPSRPQRGRRARVHPAADVQGDPQPSDAPAKSTPRS